jgi:two-component system NarL family sensor kinase
MKKILLLLLLNDLLHYQYTCAQTRTLDSIKTELSKHPERDSVRLKLLVNYVLSAVNTNTSQALPYMQEVVLLSKALNNQRGVENGYIYLQLYFSDRGDFPQAMLYADTAIYYLNLDTNAYAKKNLAYLLFNLAGDNLKLGNYNESIGNYTKAAAILEKVEPESLAGVYGGLAAVYVELEQHDKVLEYDLKAIAEAEKSKDKASIARRKLNYAAHFIQQKNFTEAEAIIHQTAPLVSETKDAISQALFYQISGQIHQDKKQYPQAIANFTAAYKMGVENDDKYQQVALLNPLVKSLINAGEMHSAQVMNDTLLAKSLLYNMPFERKNAYENASELFLLNKDYFNAYKYLALKVQLADSISSDEVKEKANKTEIRFKVAQKDREIKALQAEKELQQLQLRQKKYSELHSYWKCHCYSHYFITRLQKL